MPARVSKDRFSATARNLREQAIPALAEASPAPTPPQPLTVTDWVISPDGTRVAVYRWGTESVGKHPRPPKPWIILVHGYPDSAGVWQAVADILAEDFQVAAYDVRGAGASDCPQRQRDYRLARLSEDLQAVMDHLSPQAPVHLVAHDWGSIQTWESVTDPALQHRIASFTSLSGLCLDHAGHALRQHLRRGELGPLSRKLLRSWYIFLFQAPMLAPLAWNLVGTRWPWFLKVLEGIEPHQDPLQVSNGRQGIALYRANMLPRVLFPRQRYSRVPVQLLIARDDPFVSPEYFDQLPQWVGQIHREEIEAGHWFPLSHPHWVAAQVKTFVLGLPGVPNELGISSKPDVSSEPSVPGVH